MRRGLVLALVLVAAFPATARAAASITLSASPQPVAFDRTVHFTGAIAPAAGGQTVGLYRQSGATWTLQQSTTTAADGSFSFADALLFAGTYMASDGVVQSAPVAVNMRPQLKASVSGSHAIGGRLVLSGRMRPRVAGTVKAVVRHRGVSLRVHQLSDGHFTVRLPTTRWLRYSVRLSVDPKPGYTTAVRFFGTSISLPSLRVGSRGPSVRWLETLLVHQHYAIEGANIAYRADTFDAVLAFQKVHGLARTGTVGSTVWHVIRRAHVPIAHLRSGNHIEVEKRRQILYEVRRGRVFKVAHVSTGATGNTPVGHWHIYLKTPGYNSLEMYDSMYWHLGFAIHGYHSVPAYPGSHGCVRVPIWYASHIYGRWSVGASVYVYP